MDNFIKKDSDHKLLVITEAANSFGLSPIVLEKDFWVTWSFKKLFETSVKDALIFKGGTSLSKVYKLIERFSEDIDISIDKGFLGFKDEKDPEMVCIPT